MKGTFTCIFCGRRWKIDDPRNEETHVFLDAVSGGPPGYVCPHCATEDMKQEIVRDRTAHRRAHGK